MVKFRIIAVMAMALMLAGCVGGSSGNPTATVGLYIAGTGWDSFGDLAAQADAVDLTSIQSVWVSLARVEAKRDGRWEVMAEFSRDDGQVNLMDLQFQAQLLDERIVPAGRYTEFRLVLDNSHEVKNHVILADGTEVELKVPSSTLMIKDIDMIVAEGTVKQLVIDIDLERFVRRGESGKGFIVNPAQTIRLLEKDDFGSLYLKVEISDELLKELDGFMADLEVGFKITRLGENVPITEVVFDNGVLELSVDALLPGQYEVSAFIRWRDYELSFESKIVEIKPGLLRVESLVN